MTIEITQTGTELTVYLTGRLDTTTYTHLEDVLRQKLSGVETLVLDLAALEYLSSAGLRILLAAQKRMSTQGRMIVRNVNEAVSEIFDVTGFSDLLTIR